jgi:hypothetical protein
LGKHYNTDKYPYYTPFYHQLLNGRRDKVTSVLEIGIGTPDAMIHVSGYNPGASLRMWRDYFPNANVLGADNDPQAAIFESRIKSILWNQSTGDRWPLEDFAPFDLVVDDGSHEDSDQVRTLQLLWPLLRSGGLYIIEDVNDIQAVSKGLLVNHAIVHTATKPCGVCIIAYH